ncbi:cystathionine gamma-synthase [Rhizodiscina lignyota]|uniref:cystathionine gamma-synthase n=1 Tax=Rhizodiscina lignyota TaxID=1504668 RepID=A0A9P4M4E3_9PEZI|nr:cystathionine gamma-synthase [Rhizodiscina lignyota]
MTSTAVNIELGETIPPLTAHAVSVSLPTWKSNVGYEEGEDWVLGKMKTGYPRFFIHKSIQRFADAIIAKHGHVGEKAMLFPSHATAARCVAFVRSQVPDLDDSRIRILDLVPNPQRQRSHYSKFVSPHVSAVIYPQEHAGVAKQFWQHTGEGVSSRRAEYCHQAFSEGELEESEKLSDDARFCKGPKRYQKRSSIDDTAAKSTSLGADVQAKTNGDAESLDHNRYVEERFGRNLEVSFATDAKSAIRRRIAGTLTVDAELSTALQSAKDEERTRNVAGFSEDDVYLYPCGMNAIYNAHRCFLSVGSAQKSICYGFPYTDTLKIIQKFGPGAMFYGHGSSEELDEFERRLEGGERFLALFCEFPGNPLLKSPDLQRIRALADKYDFFVAVDETIGTMLNVNVLPYADVAVSSLTKIFSGDCNVMGGSAVLNPTSKHYQVLKRTWDKEYEDNYWAEDAIFLERNSRDFVLRIDRINENAEAICDLLRKHPRIKQVMYPKYSPTREFYDRCRTPKGGYGGLLSATFHSRDEAIVFFDNLDTAKGPSLGTNFTLSSPYVILAHYTELDWAASYGVDANLIRFSVGLEDTEELVGTFSRALAAIGGI